MQNFVSTHDVADISALIDLALKYKKNPWQTKPLVPAKDWVYYL
jgi:hypothetical protein